MGTIAAESQSQEIWEWAPEWVQVLVSSPFELAYELLDDGDQDSFSDPVVQLPRRRRHTALRSIFDRPERKRGEKKEFVII